MWCMMVVLAAVVQSLGQELCALCESWYTMFFIIISVLHVSGGISAHHQVFIKLYVQPWVLSCFPALYRWCGWVGTHDNTQFCTYSFISS